MRIRAIQNVPFEDPAGIGLWARKRGHELAVTQAYAGQPLPEPGDFDLLVLLGGDMSVHDERQFPWLRTLKDCLGRAVAAGRSVLGVCLGAQLLCEILGGRVTANAHKEIGWHRVSLTPWGGQSRAFAGFPREFTAFHWHGETFSIPRGAAWLAQSQACAHQAFAVEAKLVGLQFHLETTPESMERLMAGAASDITPGPFVQDPGDMRAGLGNLKAAGELMDKLLDNMTKEI